MSLSYQIEVRDSLAAIPAEDWNALENGGNPFLRHEFLYGLEATGCLGRATGWYPRYLLLRRMNDASDERTEDERATGELEANEPVGENSDGSDSEAASASKTDGSNGYDSEPANASEYVDSDGAGSEAASTSETDDSDGGGSEGEIVGAIPAYLKSNSYGEFVFDWAWADAYQRNGIDYYPKLVAAIPFTPATGRRVLVRQDQPVAETVSLLAAGLRQYAASEDCSGAHFLFLTEEESDVLWEAEHAPDDELESACADDSGESERTNQSGDREDSANTNDAGESVSSDVSEDSEASTDCDQTAAVTIGNTGFLRRLDCQYHWHNAAYESFDAFLAACTSKRRKTIRRERRHVAEAGLRLERRAGQTLSDEEWESVHELYRSTYDRKWGNPSLTLDFFKRMGATFGPETLIVLAYDPSDTSPEQPVACSVMFVGADTLYGRYWGARRNYNSLHFEACYYQGIDYCIEHAIARFEPGAQGEHKITRGFVPTLTRSAHWIADPRFRNAIRRFLHEEVPHVEQRCTGLADLLPFKANTLLP